MILPGRELTGLEIKQAAITQGVPIDAGFQLSVKRGNGRYEVVDDDEQIRVRRNQEFLAVPPDDNS
ncbi:multiubiquitin domain-containing protein [Streptomyces sp. NPDC002490]|uniref:multiubiquitin domain-containing protein n=1 Tax=Streptomyces sp. NPDC002490 TaxID=3154416 RepID=UPI00332B3660